MGYKVLILIALLHILILGVQAQQDEDTLPTSNELETITPDNALNIERISFANDNIRHISVSPDGKLLAVASQYQDFDYNISIREFQTGSEISSMQGRMDSFRDLIWSPDNSRIAVISGRLTGAGVQVRSVKIYTIERGNEPVYMMGHSDVWVYEEIYPLAYPEPLPGYPVDLAWSADSRMMAFALYERLLVYDVVEDEELFAADVPGIQGVDWSYDGRMIVTETDDRSVQLWAVETN